MTKNENTMDPLHIRNIGSREGQDYFAAKVTGKQKGYYLDIGCADPLTHNNTVWLHTMGWQGLCLDINPGSIRGVNERRPHRGVVHDMTQSPLEIFLGHRVPRWVDYLSFDVDGATPEAVANFPWDHYQFGAITIEHDSKPDRREAVEEYLIRRHGYRLFASNVCAVPGFAFEHWLIHPDLQPQIRFRTLGDCPDRQWWNQLCFDFTPVSK